MELQHIIMSRITWKGIHPRKHATYGISFSKSLMSRNFAHMVFAIQSCHPLHRQICSNSMYHKDFFLKAVECHVY
ncbi:hypothetical protein KP509_32G057500 [Ceratopteris richardii]|uniref:Uncharacterized protein n=1 Tax=Ceratopteris richardii TaxID=49495 RepID=A0A8T2QTM8_CERRI|nr:hypothetical protein KP509_32G057500 [Ceratopteris richardii]